MGKRHLGGVENAEGERWMGLALRLPSIHQLASGIESDDTDNSYQFWWFEDEPPKGCRANVLGPMMKCDERMLSECEKPEAHARLVLGFCFFHAVCQDR